jgi:hypothetical protein
MVRYGLVMYNFFLKVEFLIALIYVTSEKIRKKTWWQHLRSNCPWLGRLLIYRYTIGPFSTVLIL